MIARAPVEDNSLEGNLNLVKLESIETDALTHLLLLCTLSFWNILVGKGRVNGVETSTSGMTFTFGAPASVGPLIRPGGHAARCRTDRPPNTYG